jgi:hypothetical protein
VEVPLQIRPVLTKEGKGEPPMGWVRYFAKEGMIQISE